MKKIDKAAATGKTKKILIFTAIALAFSALVGWYTSSLFHLRIQVGRMMYNPFDHFKYYRIYGFPKAGFLILTVLLFVLIVYVSIKLYKNMDNLDERRNFLYSDSGVYGTAREATLGQLSTRCMIGSPELAENAILCQTKESKSSKPTVLSLKTNIPTNHNMLILGASSSGKTTTFVLPFCLQKARARESLFINDPKGEIYSKTAEYFRSLGYVVRLFNLKDPLHSDGWDIAKEVYNTPLPADDRAGTLASIIIQNICNEPGSVYAQGMTMLLQAMLLRIALDPDHRRNGTATLRTVMEIFEQDNFLEFLDNTLFSTAPNGCPIEAIEAVRIYNKTKSASANLWGNIVANLTFSLNVLSSNSIKELMSRDDIDLLLPAQQPCVYYCVASDQHSKMNVLNALFFASAFLDITEFADRQKQRRCPVPVNFLLDEFPNAGSIPDFDKKVATVRSRKIQIVIIVQDVPQLQNMYPHTYKTIMSNCATHIGLGFNDEDTQKKYSARSGESTIKTATEQHDGSETVLNPSKRGSSGDGKRALFTADELGTLKEDDVLVVLQYKRPYLGKKFFFALHPDAKYMVEKTIEDTMPEIFDEKAKQAMLEEEQARIARYAERVAEYKKAHGLDGPESKENSRKKKSKVREEELLPLYLPPENFDPDNSLAQELPKDDNGTGKGVAQSGDCISLDDFLTDEEKSQIMQGLESIKQRKNDSVSDSAAPYNVCFDDVEDEFP